jgi:hypothetical protein
MHLLKAITVSAGWLSGSAAGIGLVLYAWGYLITRSQLNLLGIESVVTYSGDQFVQEGSKFLIFVGGVVIDMLFAILAFALVLAAAGALVFIPLRAWGGRLVARLQRLSAGLVGALGALDDHLPWSPGFSLYLVLLLLMVNHLYAYRGFFTLPLGVFNLLYANASFTFGEPLEKNVSGWLLTGNVLSLKSHFVRLVYAEIQAALLLLGAWYATGSLRARPWLITPFAIMLVLYTVYLPMAYGVLVRPSRHNLITLHLKGDTARVGTGSFYLLGRGEGAFVVWDRALRRVLWIPEAAVERAEVMQAEHLFRKEGTTP